MVGDKAAKKSGGSFAKTQKSNKKTEKTTKTNQSSEIEVKAQKPQKKTKTEKTNKTKKVNLKESEAKTYISLQTPTEDNKEVKTPSYSEKKDRGLVYISHVPHGFYEKQMREFFSQFGVVTNLRLGRSKKTGKTHFYFSNSPTLNISGRSKGFAFVEFKYKEVAKIAADSMNNYLMFDKIVKCEVVPAEKCTPAVFKGKIRPHRPPGKAEMIAAKKRHNGKKTDAQNQQRQVRQMTKLDKMREKLEKAGVTYKFEVADLAESEEAKDSVEKENVEVAKTVVETS